MKLLLIVEDWISFYNQAQALSKGFQLLGIEHSIVRIKDVMKSPTICSEYKPDAVIGVGSWHSYEAFVKIPQSFGLHTVPWIVSDSLVSDFQTHYNSLPLLLTPSVYCKEIFSRDGITTSMEVLPEAVDPDVWYEPGAEELVNFAELISITPTFPIESKYNLAEIRKKNIPILFTMGGDVTSKGAQETLLALSKIDRSIEWLYILKSWPQAHTFTRSPEEIELISNLGLQDRVRYMVVDFSDRFVRNLFGLSDIYVSVSREEGFGLPLVQAQMCGKPVIGIDNFSVKEIILHNKTGLLTLAVVGDDIIKADIHTLKEQLESLITNRALRQKMGVAGKKYALENFQPKHIAKRMLAYLN